MDNDHLHKYWIKLRNNPPDRKDPGFIQSALEVADEAERMVKDIRQYAFEYLSGGGTLPSHEVREGYGVKKWDSTTVDKAAGTIVDEWQFLDAKGALRHLINNNLLTPSAALKLFTKNSEYDIEQFIETELGKPKLFRKKEI